MSEMSEAAIADDLEGAAAAYTPTESDGDDEQVPGTIQELRQDGVDDLQQARCVLRTSDKGLVDTAWERVEVLR